MPTLPSNIFQRFRNPGHIYTSDVIAGGKISKTFDEPTYLTFRLGFRPANTNVEMTNYDKMPHPLFELYQEDNMDVRNYYSSIQYLRDSNEFVRAQMLQDFIEKWNILQNDYQWSFQTISGLDSILKVDPKRGMRVAKDAKITITLLESLDWKIIHLLNEYKKIAWDDTYQRWILPDMMRYFVMDIFITEFRIFHKSNFTEPQATSQGAKKLVSGSEAPNMVLSIIDDLMPTYVIHCERCEFDITSFNSQFNTLSTIGGDEMVEMSFDILVGNYTEEYRNTLLDYYWTDRIINGIERTQEFDIVQGEPVTVTGQTAGTNTGANSQNVPYTPTRLSKNTNANPFINHDMDYGDKMMHQSGQPFIESGGIGASSSNIGSTWVGNALKFGKAYGKNLVEGYIDKAKMSEIPGMGVSFNEALTVLQSKDIFSVLGLVKQAITQSAMNTTPSQYLDNKVIETTFKEVLTGISLSTATTEEGKNLVDAAIKALNDRAIMEKINDFSKATDLVSSKLGEKNISLEIENKNTLKDAVIESTKVVEKEIGTHFIFEGLPSSMATQSTIDTEKLYKSVISVYPESIEKASFSGEKGITQIQVEKIESVPAGKATDGKESLAKTELISNKTTGMEGDKISMPDPGAAIGGVIDGGDFISPESLNSLTGAPLKRPEPGKAEENKLK